ncbi:MAG: OmpA family protein [Paracoccaceae bacterium]
MIRRSVYEVPDPTLTTLQMTEPLRLTLEDAGYREVFQCIDSACGGFDFRFQLDLLPPPAMFVDLGNYRYLLMEHKDASAGLIAVVASSSEVSGYVHVTEVLSEPVSNNIEAPVLARSEAPERDDLTRQLIETGHVVLGDLSFTTGSAELGPGPFASLQVLADWLAEFPSARVVLVGHTDGVGSLDANLALSRRRAASVQERLVNGLGARAEQVASDGAGALSPRATNLTDDGRALNRRVEVVLLGIE